MKNTIYRKVCLTAIGTLFSVGVLVAPTAHAATFTAFEARSLTFDALVHAFPHKKRAVLHRRGIALRSISYRRIKLNHHGAVVRSATFHKNSSAGGLRKASARKSLNAHRVIARKAIHRGILKSSRT